MAPQPSAGPLSRRARRWPAPGGPRRGLKPWWAALLLAGGLLACAGGALGQTAPEEPPATPPAAAPATGPQPPAGPVEGAKAAEPPLWPQDGSLLVWRAYPANPQAPVTPPPLAQQPRPALLGGGPRPLGKELLRVKGARKVRVESEAEGVAAVIRYLPAPTPPGQNGKPGWVMTVVVFSRQSRWDLRYTWTAQTLQNGQLAPTHHHWLEPSITTELAGVGPEGAAIQVDRLVVQDDYYSELALRQEGETLVLKVTPGWAGGHPSETPRPWYQGMPLTFLDYTLLGGGYTSNGFGDLRLFEDFGAAFHMAGKDGSYDLLGRGVVRVQWTRTETMAVWMEGGAAYAQKAGAAGQITWVLGPSVHFRWGNWGTALAAQYTTPLLAYQLYGGWQPFQDWGFLLYYQGVGSYSGYGLGASVRF